MPLHNKIRLPEEHKLVRTHHKIKGTLAQNEYWYYDEINCSGEIIATYKYWECTSMKPPHTTREGFMKYNPEGEQMKG